MKIMDRFKNLKKKILLSEIWIEVKQFVDLELDMGNITEVLQKKRKKFSTCPAGFPPEYCSKDNVEETYIVETDKGIILQVMQGYYGLNFEDSCDRTAFSILDANSKLLYNSSDHSFQKKKTETKNRNITK